jgi:hypothetical protein
MLDLRVLAPDDLFGDLIRSIQPKPEVSGRSA